MGRGILKHSVEFLVLYLPVAGVVNRFYQLLHIYRQLKLLIYYFYKHFFVDMTTFVRRPPDRRVRVQCVLIILAVQLRCFQLLVHPQNRFEFYVPLIVGIKLRYQLAQLELLIMYAHFLEDGFDVVDGDLAVAIVV